MLELYVHNARAVSRWLRATDISGAIQRTSWAIPLTQTIHIVCVAIVISSTFFVCLRMLSAFDRTEAVDIVANRFLPWVWAALAVLLVTGSLLITAEPARELLSPAFLAKMAMLVAVVALTAAIQRPLAHEPDYWRSSARRVAAGRGIAILSLILWSLIVFAGRWIAYAGTLSL